MAKHRSHNSENFEVHLEKRAVSLVEPMRNIIFAMQHASLIKSLKMSVHEGIA